MFSLLRTVFRGGFFFPSRVDENQWILNRNLSEKEPQLQFNAAECVNTQQQTHLTLPLYKVIVFPTCSATPR